MADTMEGNKIMYCEGCLYHMKVETVHKAGLNPISNTWDVIDTQTSHYCEIQPHVIPNDSIIGCDRRIPIKADKEDFKTVHNYRQQDCCETCLYWHKKCKWRSEFTRPTFICDLYKDDK